MTRGWIGMLLLSASTLAAGGCANESTPEVRANERPVRAEEADPVVDPVLEARRTTLERGATLQAALQELGLGAGEALELSREIDAVHSVRELRPGTSLTLEVDADGLPAGFQMWPDVRTCVSASRGNGSWAASVTAPELERYVRFLSGEIEGSFYDAMVSAGGDAALVLEVSDILQWDLDFFLDPRVGDRFAILVEEWVDGREIVSHGDVLAIEYMGDKVQIGAYRRDDGESGSYYRADGTSVRRSLLKSPLNYRRISSHFSHKRFHPILRKYRPHLGVDYAADSGTPVVSIGDGTVTFVGNRGGFGKTVEVRHNASLISHYAHFSGYARNIKRGSRVKQGQVIGYVGSTGLSTGPHLDFRCKVNGSWVNPLRLERPPAEPVPEELRPGFRAHAERVHRVLGTLDRDGFLTWSEYERCQRVAAAGGTGERIPTAGAPG